MIDIPGIGQVEAKGAASEATLRELLKAMKTGSTAAGKPQAGGGGADLKAQKNRENADNSTARQSNVLGNMFGIVGKSAGLTAFGLGRMTKFVESTGRGLLGLGETVTQVVDKFANVGDSVEGAAGIFAKVPLVGTVFAAVAKAATATTDAFQRATASGATFGGSVTGFSKAASGAGMTMEKYGQLISQNGDAMRLLGGNTEAGANRFSQISKALRTSSNDLYALGYSTDDVNQGLANYSKFLGSTGKIQGMSNADLAKGAKSYLKEIDALAKVTGETRKQQEDAMAKLTSDAQYQAAVNSMSADAGKRFAQTITGLPEGLRDVAKDIMVTGTATTEESQQFMALMPKSAAKMAEFAEMSKKGIAPTVAQQQELQNLLKMEGSAQKKQFGDNARYNKDIAKTYNMMNSAANITTDGLIEATKATEDAAKTTDGQAAAIEKTKQGLAEFSNGFQMALANSGILEVLMKSFTFLANLVTTFVVPAFTMMANLLSVGLSTALDIVIPLFNDYLVPALQIFTGFLVDYVIPAVTDLAAYLKDTFMPVFQDIGTFIKETLYPAFLDMVVFIRDSVIPTLTSIYEVVSSIVVPVLKMLGGIIMDYVWPAFKAIAGFINDNLSPIFATLLTTLAAYVGYQLTMLIPTLLAQIPPMLAMIPPMLAVAGAALLAAAPFIAIAAVIGLAVVGFYKLYEKLADMGYGFNMIGDGLKLLKLKISEFMGDLGDVISKIPGMGRSTEEQKVRDEQKALLEKEKTEISTRLEEKRKQNAFERTEEGKQAAQLEKVRKREELSGKIDQETIKLKESGKKVIGDPKIGKGGAGGELDKKLQEKQKQEEDNKRKQIESIEKESAKALDLSSPTAALMSFAEQQKSSMLAQGKAKADAAKLGTAKTGESKDPINDAILKGQNREKELQRIKDQANEPIGKAVGAGTAPRTPSSAATAKAEAPKTEMEKQAADKAAQQKALAEAEKKGSDKLNLKEKTTAPQESAESLLASLNNKMDALISLNRQTVEVNQRQLSVQSNLSSDMFNVA